MDYIVKGVENMAVLSKDDFFKAIKSKIGEDTSDETIKFLEDITDTYNDLSNSSKGSGEDWQKRYEENDKMWREKYKERFFGATDETQPIIEPKPEEKDPEIEKAETIKINDLFTPEKKED